MPRPDINIFRTYAADLGVMRALIEGGECADCGTACAGSLCDDCAPQPCDNCGGEGVTQTRWHLGPQWEECCICEGKGTI